MWYRMLRRLVLLILVSSCSLNPQSKAVQTVDDVIANEQQILGQSITIRGFLRFGTDSKNLWNDRRAYANVDSNEYPPDHPAWNHCITMFSIGKWRELLLANNNRYVVVTGVLQREVRKLGDITTNACSELGISIFSLTKG